MNRKTILLLSALALVLLLFFFLRRDTGKTLSGNDRNFEFTETGGIDRIFLSNKLNRSYIDLKKKGKNLWTVNDSFTASIHQIEIFLDGLRKMRVKRPVSKNEKEMVRKDIALNGIKTEIYENGRLSKVFYTGNNTQDAMGTYFLMEGAEEPYVCHIPGFNGFLNARYHTMPEAWRSKSIFSNKDEEIASIEINWPEDASSSFSVSNQGAEPQLSSGGKLLANNSEVNLNLLRAYLKLWENLSFEGFPIDLNEHKIDSISRTLPLMTISLTDKNGKKTTLSIHRKGIKRDSNIQYDDQGNPLRFDVETYYAFINGNRKEIVQIQDYIFGKVMKKTSDFRIGR